MVISNSPLASGLYFGSWMWSEKNTQPQWQVSLSIHGHQLRAALQSTTLLAHSLCRLLDCKFSLRSWSFQYLLLHSPLSWWLCSLFHWKMEVIGNKLSQAFTIEHTDLPAFIPRYLAVSSARSMCGVCSYHYLRPKLGVDPEENSDTHFQWVIKSH